MSGQDIRKWFMKQHEKGSGNVNASKQEKTTPQPEKSVPIGEESSGRRKTSKYFATENKSAKVEKEVEDLPVKRKASRVSDVKSPPAKKVHKVEEEDDEEEDFVMPTPKKSTVSATPSKKLKSDSGKSIAKKSLEIVESDDEDDNKPLKPAGRGRGGGRGGPASKKAMDIDEVNDEEDDKAKKSAGRGRGGGGRGGGRGGGGGGRGGFNFGERKDPPHKGEKEIPEGAPNCLTGLTFVISGTLDSLEREEAEDLIKRHGGRVTGSVSKKTNYLLCDEDIGGRKSEKATELGTTFLTEDGLFEMISKSNKSVKKEADKIVPSPVKKTPLKTEIKPKSEIGSSSAKKVLTPTKQGTTKTKDKSMLSWTDKYKPKVSSDIIGNPGLVKQLHDWLVNWNEQFLNTSNKGKKKQNDPSAKKAVLLCGTPGIGKTTSAKLVSQMLGFQAIEVNASDNRGKANAKIEKGIGGSRANSVKELVSNQSLGLNMKLRGDDQKTVLIMDEVDGMSAGDRGGVADLIASIKMSKVPIICICNDRYSQKLKSLINYCLLLSYRKPTKQQMAKRLMQVASAEGLKVNEIALEELADRVNGDMRMAINQLQYMSLSNSVIGYDDIRKRLQTSSKDEDISPFTAVDKLFTSDKLRMDQKIDLSMSDADLVPLLIQENYINHRPRSLNGYDKSNKVKQTENELKHLSLLAKAAESIADGDIVNVQIRRYQQWQLSQTSVLASCIIPSTLLNGQRTVLEQGERNFNRFGSWLGKNSTTGKNYRLLEDLHVHLLASRESYLGRKILRLDYIILLKKELTDPLRLLPKDEAVEKVINFMDSYSISMDDYDSIMEISKFQGHPSPLDGIQPAVKSALTRGYNKGSKSRVIKTADLINLPGIKKAPKKRVAAMLEQVEQEEKLDNNEDEEEEDDNDDDDAEVDSGKKLQSDLQSLNSKGIQVEMELKGSGNSSGKKTPASRGKGSAAQGKRGGSNTATATATGSASKRKR